VDSLKKKKKTKKQKNKKTFLQCGCISFCSPTHLSRQQAGFKSSVVTQMTLREAGTSECVQAEKKSIHNGLYTESKWSLIMRLISVMKEEERKKREEVGSWSQRGAVAIRLLVKKRDLGNL